MKSKKILIIVIIIIAVLAVAGTTFGYLFVATDIFKSDKELFAKYMSQNVEAFQELTNLQTSQVYKDLKNEPLYESNTKLTMTYSEGGEISNPLNDLSAEIEVQKNDDDNYFYADGQILFAGEEYWETEILKEQGLYGIKFSDVAKQFITIKNDSNLDAVANNIEVDANKLEEVMDIIDGTREVSEELFTKEEIDTLKQKYINIVTESIANGEFSSIKKAMITYNNNTIKTNSYIVNLSSQQVENMLVKILNNLKTETVLLEKIQNFVDKEEYTKQIEEIIKTISEEKEMPSMKMTVYEQNEQTVRTVIEIDTYKIVIENLKENEELKTKIQLSDLNTEKLKEYNIEINKKNTSNQENFNINIEVAEGEEKQIISFLNEMQLDDSTISLNSSISYKKDILIIGAKIENTVKIGENFENKQTLENNSVVLNELEEARRTTIIDTLKEKVPEKFAIRLDLLRDALGLKESETDNNITENEMSQVEINKFNAKFEFYTGDAVSSENVKAMLETVKNNLGSYEMIQLENTENVEQEAKYIIKLNIEKNKTDEDSINQILEKIEDKKKYEVAIVYKESNGLIDYITIKEVED